MFRWFLLALSCSSSSNEKSETTEEEQTDVTTDLFSATVSVCDGERLEAPPGGFVCTGLALPDNAAYGLLEVADSPSVVLLPLLEQDGNWVTVAPLLADTQGVWSGAVTYHLHDDAGNVLSSVEGVVSVSSEPVSDAASELSAWRSAVELSWATSDVSGGRNIGYLGGLFIGLFEEALQRSYSPALFSGEEVQLQSSDSEEVVRAIQQFRSELFAAGMPSEWLELDAGLVRSSFLLLPSPALNPDEGQQRSIVLKAALVIVGYIAFKYSDIILPWIVGEAASRIITSHNDNAEILCTGELAVTLARPQLGYQCIELNPDEPLSAELEDLLPEADELEDYSAEDITPAPEGFVDGECSDGVDNDGNGLVDEDDAGCDETGDCIVTVQVDQCSPINPSGGPSYCANFMTCNGSPGNPPTICECPTLTPPVYGFWWTTESYCTSIGPNKFLCLIPNEHPSVVNGTIQTFEFELEYIPDGWVGYFASFYSMIENINCGESITVDMELCYAWE